MRAVVQRVTEAQVTVDGAVVGAIGPGLVALVGVTHDDDADAPGASPPSCGTCASSTTSAA